MEMMEKLGIEWTVGPGADWDAYPDEVLENADAVLIRLEKCPEHFVSRCKNLKALGRPGMGFENVPVDYCTRRGSLWCWRPEPMPAAWQSMPWP